MTESRSIFNRQPVKTMMITVMMVLCLVLSGCEKEELYEEVDGILQINTSYCTLQYPAKWKDNLKVEESGEIVQFSAVVGEHEEQHLFDVVFGEERETTLGQIQTEDGRIVSVSLVIHLYEPDKTWAAEDVQIVSGMLDDLNYLTNALPVIKQNNPSGIDEPEQEAEDILIETPFGVLYYPGRWQEYLRIERIESNTCCLSFYACLAGKEDTHLFDLVMESATSAEYCMLIEEDGTVIALEPVVIPFVADDSWTDAQIDVITGMQESLNELLDRVPRYDPMAEDIMIRTPYVDLCIPSVLQDSFRTWVQNGSTYVVTFLTADGRAKLFDVILQPNRETEYGGFMHETGGFIGVDVTYYPLTMDESWTDEAINTAYSLLEIPDYMLNKLPLERKTSARDEEFAKQEEQGNSEQNPMQEDPIPANEDIVVNTPYGELRYPGQWRGMLEYEVTESEVYKVAYYGVLDNGQRIQLFTVNFGGNDGIIVGSIPHGTDGEIDLRIEYIEVDPATVWDESNLDVIYAMQEDVNYLMDAFFTP